MPSFGLSVRAVFDFQPAVAIVFVTKRGWIRGSGCVNRDRHHPQEGDETGPLDGNQSGTLRRNLGESRAGVNRAFTVALSPISLFFPSAR
jgi:hypothetical protein